jgi:hypothetical protein
VSAVEDAKALVEVGGTWIGHGAATLLRVLRAPVAFVRSLDLDDPPVRDAALFAVFISLLSLVLYIPVFRMLGVEVETTSFVLIDTVVTFAFWFVQATIVHTVARLLGVRGRTLQATLVVFLYLTAFMPIQMLIFAPFSLVVRRWMIDDGDVRQIFDPGLVLRLVGESPAVAVSVAVGIVFGTALVIVYAASFRAAYRIGWTRAFAIIILSLLATMAWAAAVEHPVQQMMFRAFHRPAAQACGAASGPQRVLRNSTSARFSPAERLVPYRCPALLLPGSAVS